MLSECVESFTCHSSVSAIQTSNVHLSPSLANGLTISNDFALLLDILLSNGTLKLAQTVWPWRFLRCSRIYHHGIHGFEAQTSSDLIPANTWYVSISQNTPQKKTVDPKKTHPLCFHFRIIHLRQ